MDQPEAAVAMLNAFVHDEARPFQSTDSAEMHLPVVQARQRV